MLFGRLFVILFFSFLLSACFETETRLLVEKNGDTTLTYTVTVKAELVPVLKEHMKLKDICKEGLAEHKGLIRKQTMINEGGILKCISTLLGKFEDFDEVELEGYSDAIGHYVLDFDDENEDGEYAINFEYQREYEDVDSNEEHNLIQLIVGEGKHTIIIEAPRIMSTNGERVDGKNSIIWQRPLSLMVNGKIHIMETIIKLN